MLPPMNDRITLFIPKIDEATGEPLKDKYGREIGAERFETEARVRYTAEVIFGRAGNQMNAIIEAALPPDVHIKPGIAIEWIDHNDTTVTGTIENVKSVLSWSGKKIYWWKVYIT